MAGRWTNAVKARAELHDVDIEREDLFLREAPFECHRQKGFLDLSPNGLLVRKPNVLRELHRERRAPADKSADLQVVSNRVLDSLPNETLMGIEARILHRQQSRDDMSAHGPERRPARNIWPHVSCPVASIGLPNGVREHLAEALEDRCVAFCFACRRKCEIDLRLRFEIEAQFPGEAQILDGVHLDFRRNQARPCAAFGFSKNRLLFYVKRDERSPVSSKPGNAFRGVDRDIDICKRNGFQGETQILDFQLPHSENVEFSLL